jgi:alpha-amylase/alpha-mannosidase (GH57 family)
LDKKVSLCIHSHFYQPPRENAWTGEIEPQQSAAPFHDWNERILQECYKPNSEAVIVDEHDNVIKRINNYEYFNFDFGPTLLSWIKKKHHKTYERIIEADKRSTEVHSGHGNAIAMIYNHVIMPLANYNDKITQVKWGVADFKFHFGREPAGIWLPETACNEETLEVLVNEGIKYIILDPSQASKVRKIHHGKWKDVSSGNINTEISYHCYLEKYHNKFINIFFYNGSLSKNIAFDDHIFNSTRLLQRLEHVPIENKKSDNLISAAVDGETFGHHKHYTERSMAYLFSELIPLSKFKIVNFGEYLSLQNSEYEVKLKEGKNGDGTSWSCPHGVARWKENCGCGNSNENSSQEWRKPLRDSLNWLRDELIVIFEKIGNNFFKNIWKARNEYISLILVPYKESRERFFYFNVKKFLSDTESDICIKLLEMQKYSMLMFTSCGWFFSDISGIETIQILQYAARAMELAKEVSGTGLEEEFLKRLSEAKSNLDKYKDGKDLYTQEVSAVRK